ncbi:hypothetical protein ACQEU3_14850 [Spirillospora sp. CA-253888]
MNPGQSPPPPGSVVGAGGLVCLSEPKLQTPKHGITPKVLCETSPGKWTPVDPDKLAQPPVCHGKKKHLALPGAPLPDTLCEIAPGKWVRDPSSTYKNNGPGKPRKGCAFGDLACMAGEAVTGWFRDLVESARKPVFTFLASTVLGTPAIDSPHMKRPRQIWDTSRWIANTCFVLLVMAGGALIMAGTAFPSGLAPAEVAPRLVWAFVAANLSLVFIGYGIAFANGLASAFLDAGGKSIDPVQAGKVMGAGIEATINTAGVFVILLALVAVVLALIVAFIYVARLAITMVLIAAAPLALMFHALPATDGIARMWWRAMTGLLAIQVCQSLVLVTALQVLFTTNKQDGMFAGVPTTRADFLDLLLVICLLWVMIRIPSWVARSIWRDAYPRTPGRLLKSFVLYRGAGTLFNRLGAAGTAARHLGRPHSGNGPGPRRPRPGPGRPSPGRPGPNVPRPQQPGTGPAPASPTPPSPPGAAGVPGALPGTPSGPPPLAFGNPPATPSPSPGSQNVGVVYRVPRRPTPPPPPAPQRPVHAASPDGKQPPPAPASPSGPPGNGAQLALPIPVRPAPGTGRPLQTALPIPIVRVPARPLPPEPPLRPAPRSRQLMFPEMPKRPVPPRQLTLWIDRGKNRRS